MEGPLLKKIRHSISLQIAKYNHVFCRDNDEYSRGIIAGLELVEQILDECETAPKTPEGAGTAINSESAKSYCELCGKEIRLGSGACLVGPCCLPEEGPEVQY